HKTAPLTVREEFALPAAVQDTLLTHLLQLPNVNEAILLSTCNRTEIYCDTDDPSIILPWILKELRLSPDLITPHCYIHQGDDALSHVLRVAIGLDSMMLGEPQILGQMKQAYQEACRIGAVKSHLHQMFQYVFQASKRVRNESGIGNNPVSVAFSAVQLIKRLFSNIKALNVLVIGSGETARLVAKYLRQQGAAQFMFASRAHANANRLAEQFDGEAFAITDIPLYLAKADVVISATACPLPFISKKLVTFAMTQRAHTPMFFLDLAVPRDIEPDVSSIEDVHLYNIDDLYTLIEKGMNDRKVAARKAEQLIEAELQSYTQKQLALRAKDAICDYRSQMKELAQLELQRALQKLSIGQCQYSVLTEFSERLVNKLTHAPTVRLRQVAENRREELLDLARNLIEAPTEVASYEKVT
ncbi:MAG: glutamyl-tRNA reductase, partial [Methylococcales bacterium]